MRSTLYDATLQIEAIAPVHSIQSPFYAMQYDMLGQAVTVLSNAAAEG